MRRSPPGRIGVADLRDLAARRVEEEPAALVPEAVDQGRGDRGLAGRDPGEAPEHIGDHLAEHRAARRKHAARFPVEPAVPRDQEREEQAGVGTPPPDRVELRARSRVRTHRAARARAGRRRPGPGWSPASGDGRRFDAPPPGRRLRFARPRRAGAAGSSRCSARSSRGDVVGPAPLPVDGPVPEDRVTDEAVGAPSVKQAAELPLGALAVEAPPDDRVKAGVPVPLPRVVARTGARVGEGNAVPLALDPALAQGLLGDPHHRRRGPPLRPPAAAGDIRRSFAACLGGRSS